MTEPIEPVSSVSDQTQEAVVAPEAPEAATIAEPDAAASTDARVENILRGTLFALAALPAGVIAWVVIWQLGFISAIVAFGVVALAAFLYRLGSGGRISAVGVAVIVAITIVTLVISFLAGMAVDMASALGYVLPASLNDPLFWDDFAYNVFDNPELWAEYTWSIVMSVAFAALGAFSVIRQLAKQARTSV